MNNTKKKYKPGQCPITTILIVIKVILQGAGVHKKAFNVLYTHLMICYASRSVLPRPRVRDTKLNNRINEIKSKNSLRIHEENTKENHNRVVSLYVIKTRLLFSSNFLGLENVNFQTFFAN